ncbi:sodium/calcium exchanger 1-like [Convolutriloba macropyga]|uniref:sodium/calcium exchanger 1-like n=1 Tax=Convolutriloba macropyga TaxID=536237 RepID=UPI003F51D490
MMSYSTLLLLSCFVPVLFLSGSVRGNSTTEYDQCDPNAPKEPCSTGGIILPRWGTDGEEISTATMILRATIYFLGLCYMFLGVSQIADLFMEAIEVITSTTSVRVVKTSSGEYKEVEVQVWNETVANLTLMALGSSAPEILLSVIEICGNNFKAGDLGPGTIVGSAAFNLFVITALCVSVIPDGTGKSVKNFGVFACTASWSIGAYVWLYLMIAVITKEKVDWWEGLITLLLFGAFILMSYTIDRKNEACALGFRYVGIYDPEGDGEGGDTAVVTANGEGSEKLPLNDVENGMAADNSRATDGPSQAALTLSKMVQQKMSTKEKIMARLKEIADKNPSEPDSWLNKVDSELSQIIFYGKSRAYFRIHKVDVKNQTEKYRKFLREAVSNLSEIKKDSATRNVVFCADTKVKFAESCGTGKVVIERAGPFLETSTTKLQYAVVESETAKNAATAKKDFEPSNGWLEFAPGETQKTVDVVIYDDPEFEEDEEFVVKLFDIQETTSDVPKAYVTYMHNT